MAAQSIVLPLGESNKIRPLHIMLMLSVVLCLALWGIQSVFGLSTHAEGLEFSALLSFYALASLVFLLPRARTGRLPFFQLPVFFTLTSFVRFGVAPAFSFIDPNHFDKNLRGNYNALVTTLLVWIVAMFAFWVACSLLRGRKEESEFVPTLSAARSRFWGRSSPAVITLLLIVGTAANVYNFRTYRGISLDDFMASASSVGVVNVLTDISAWALVLAAIEYYENPNGGWQKILFLASFGLQCVWGFTAMMKSEMIRPLLLVALVASFVRSRFDKKWLAIAVLGLVVVYPLQKQFPCC